MAGRRNKEYESSSLYIIPTVPLHHGVKAKKKKLSRCILQRKKEKQFSSFATPFFPPPPRKEQKRRRKKNAKSNKDDEIPRSPLLVTQIKKFSLKEKPSSSLSTMPLTGRDKSQQKVKSSCTMPLTGKLHENEFPAYAIRE